MLPLEPHHVAAAYEFMRALPPVCRWRLPPADAVEFRIAARRDIHGELTHWLHDGTHIITVSSETIGHTKTLLEALGHELVHMRQYLKSRDWHSHGEAFQRDARLLCRYHGFDPKAF